MKSLILGAFVLIFAQISHAQTSCELGAKHDRAVVQTVLEDMIQNDRVQIDAASGTLRLSVSPVNVVQLNNGTTTARVTVTRSYHNLQSPYAPLQERIEYTTQTTACRAVIVNEVRSGESFLIGNTVESSLLKIALGDVMTADDFIPARHSGAMSLVLRMPVRCNAAASEYNLTIQKTSQSSGIASKVSTYLIDGGRLSINKKDERWGRLLGDLCP